jgi:hypothetical protein
VPEGACQMYEYHLSTEDGVELRVKRHIKGSEPKSYLEVAIECSDRGLDRSRPRIAHTLALEAKKIEAEEIDSFWPDSLALKCMEVQRNYRSKNKLQQPCIFTY